jgi:hypothetical protein
VDAAPGSDLQPRQQVATLMSGMGRNNRTFGKHVVLTRAAQTERAISFSSMCHGRGRR